MSNLVRVELAPAPDGALWTCKRRCGQPAAWRVKVVRYATRSDGLRWNHRSAHAYVCSRHALELVSETMVEHDDAREGATRGAQG